MTEIRELPAQEKRVETGPVRFGDDWPGVFIRGDEAGWWAMQLKWMIAANPSFDPITRVGLEGLQQVLAGCIVGPAAELLALSREEQ